jgi:hypothetical protein
MDKKEIPTTILHIHARTHMHKQPRSTSQDVKVRHTPKRARHCSNCSQHVLVRNTVMHEYYCTSTDGRYSGSAKEKKSRLAACCMQERLLRDGNYGYPPPLQSTSTCLYTHIRESTHTCTTSAASSRKRPRLARPLYYQTRQKSYLQCYGQSMEFAEHTRPTISHMIAHFGFPVTETEVPYICSGNKEGHLLFVPLLRECHLRHTLSRTNTGSWDRPEKNKERKNEDKKNKKGSGKPGCWCYTPGSTSTVTVPACQAQICSLAKNDRPANAWLHLTTVIITVATLRILFLLFLCWHGILRSRRQVSDDMTVKPIAPSLLLRSGSESTTCKSRMQRR